MAKSTRKKADATATHTTVAAPPNTLDVGHEDVTHGKEGDVKPAGELKILTTQELIDQAVARLSPFEQRIADAKAQYGALTIGGVEDEEGLKAAKKAFTAVRTIRTDAEKLGKALRADQNLINKAISAKEDKVIADVAPLEKALSDKIEEVEDAIEAAEREKEEAAEQKLKARLEALKAEGMVFDGSYYSIGGKITIDVVALRGIPDAAYEELLEKVKTTNAELKDAKTKADQEAKDAQDKLDQERADARKAIKEMRGGMLELLGFTEVEGGFAWDNGHNKIVVNDADVLDCQQFEFKIALEALKGKIAAANEAKKKKADQDETDRKAREKQAIKDVRATVVKTLGFKVDKDGDLVYDNGHSSVGVDGAEVWDLDETGFNAKLTQLRETVEKMTAAKKTHDDNVEAERLALIARKEEVANVLQGAGMTYNYGTEAFTYTNPLFSITHKMADMLLLDENDLTMKGYEVTKQIADAKKRHDEKLQKDRDDLEKERLAKLGDAERFLEMLANVRGVAVAVKPALDGMTTDVYREKAERFGARLFQLLKDFAPEEVATP